MNRERIAWLVSTVLIAMVAFYVPGTLAQRDDDYAFVRTLVDIHRQVVNNYVDPVDEEKLRQGAIDGMLEQLDPFSAYVPPKRQEEFDRMLEGTFKGIGVQLDQKEDGTITVISPIDGSPAFKAGVLAGDVIVKVNGEEVKAIRLPDLIKKISTGPLDVTMRVRHPDGQEVDLPVMTRTEIVLPTVKGYRRKPNATWDWFVSQDPKIGYLRITQFTPDTSEKTKAGVKQMLDEGAKGVILDLRFNPGGRLDEAIKIVDLFVKEGVIVSTKGRNRPEEKAEASGKGTLPDFPMVVLVNEHSASASEIVAGSLLDNHRALIVGTRTYGKGSVQEVVKLGDGKDGELKLTVAYYYLPSGRLVHRKKDATDWGVEPQIIVPMDLATERLVMQQQADLDIIGRPQTGPSTKPGTKPTTQPAAVVDRQLAAAVSTMIGHIVLTGKQEVVVPGSGTVVQPTTAPVVPTTAPAGPTTGPTTKP